MKKQMKTFLVSREGGMSVYHFLQADINVLTTYTFGVARSAGDDDTSGSSLDLCPSL